jgi:PucR family transcriptional regulator, purine catabolism regulatory protein
VLFHATYRADTAAVLAARASLESTALPLAVPIPTSSRSRAESTRLVVLPLDSPINDDTRVAAERAVGALAIALLRPGEDILLIHREHGAFLNELLNGGATPNSAAARADALQFRHDGPWVLPIALAPGPGRAGPAGDAAWDQVCREVRAELRDRRLPVLIGPDIEGLGVLSLVGITDPERRPDVIGQVAAAVRQACDRHLGSADAAVIAGGRVCEWDDVGSGLFEAAGVAVFATHHHLPAAWHDVLVPSLHRLVWQLRTNTDLSTFARRFLAPVLDHEDARATPLLSTIQALCEHGWRKAEVARALHLERQSLYYRLERIEQLLGLDLSEGETRTALHLAVLTYLAQNPESPSTHTAGDSSGASLTAG